MSIVGPFPAGDSPKQESSYLLFFLDSQLVPIRGTGLVSTWLGLWPLTGMTPERPWVSSWFQHSGSPDSGQLHLRQYVLQLSSQQLRGSGMPPSLYATPFCCLATLLFLSDEFFSGPKLSFPLWNVFLNTPQNPLACPHFFPTTSTPPQPCCHGNGQSLTVPGCAVVLATTALSVLEVYQQV